MTLVSMSPQYLLTVTVSQTIFVLDDLDRFWGRLDRYFSDAPLVQFVLSFFKKIMVCLWLWGFWVKTTELKCPSRYMVRRTCSVHIDLDRGATAIYCQFPPLWSFSPRSAFQTVFFGTMSQVIRSGESGSLFWDWRISIIYLEFFCTWDLPLPMEKF